MVTATRPRPPYRYLDSQREFDAFLGRIKKESLLAVDTEAASFHRFVDRIYLIQVSTRTDTAIIDPLTVPDVKGLGAIIADPNVEAVFHDADYDLRILHRDYAISAHRIFDTRIAAQLLGEKAVGLAALLEKHLGVKLDKKHQRADWSRRPLPADMLDYAAQDTRHLPRLRDILKRELEGKGRLSWAEEEFERLEHLKWTPAETNGDGYLRVKGARLLSRRGLALLRELVHWRDDVAREMDRASFRVVGNEALLAVAGKTPPPKTAEELKAISGVPPRLVDQRGGGFLGAIERGLAVPEKDLPRFPRGERRAADPAFDARVEKLKATRNQAAEKLELDQGVLCPKGTLEAVARAKPASLDAMKKIPEMRKWQVEVLGKQFLEALAQAGSGSETRGAAATA